ncbi:MAG: hypothetical protein MJ224_07880 [archaeon]|nr:hypothetical protein [archaeon]
MLKLDTTSIKTGTIVLDMDDVLAFTTSYWFKLIYDRLDVFEPVINKNMIPDDYEYNKDIYYPMERPTYYFADWLLKNNLTTDEELFGRKCIMDIFISNNNIYDYISPAPIIPSIIDMFNNKSFKFDKICIVTRSFDEHYLSKTAFIKRNFASIIDNVEILFTDIDEKKSDVIKNIEHVSLIIDDELSNIYDYIDNSTNIEGSTILIPRTGYNQDISKEYLKKANDKKISVNYYSYN